MRLANLKNINVDSGVEGEATLKNVYTNKSTTPDKTVPKKKKSVYGGNNPAANVSGDGADGGAE